MADDRWPMTDGRWPKTGLHSKIKYKIEVFYKKDFVIVRNAQLWLSIRSLTIDHLTIDHRPSNPPFIQKSPHLQQVFPTPDV
jgi:hypothetical protein